MTTPALTPVASPDRAKMFAELAHTGQTYNDEVPYTFHLDMVVKTLILFGFHDVEMQCAAWMHDTLEDTNRNYNDILKRFGREVAELVYAVTSELGRNRGERNEKTYPKIRGNERATALKLADRIANVEYGLASGGTMFKKYQEEFSGFEKALRVQNNEDQRVTRMWDHLKRLLAA